MHRVKTTKKRVAILGATGLVGRRFVELLADHPWFQIELLVGDKSNGEDYGSVWRRKEALLQDHYGDQVWCTQKSCPPEFVYKKVSTFEEVLASRAIDLVFSAVPENAGHLEQQLADRGLPVFSNSPHGRFEEANPLIVTEVNGNLIGKQPFIKNPNCVTSGLAMLLAPIREHYGLREVSVVTFQSLSGRGDAKYKPEQVVGNVYPLHDTAERTEEYIAREVQKIFKLDNMAISVSCNRVFVQEGHFVDVKLKTEKRIDSEEAVFSLFEAFQPLKECGLPSAPEFPVIVVREPGRPRPRQDANHGNGMSVAVGNVSTSDRVFDLRFQYVVNNVVRRGRRRGVER